jgi:hypothetical protein
MVKLINHSDITLYRMCRKSLQGFMWLTFPNNFIHWKQSSSGKLQSKITGFSLYTCLCISGVSASTGKMTCSVTCTLHLNMAFLSWPHKKSIDDTGCQLEPSRRRLKVVTMRKLTFENFLFQQGYHRGDWLSWVKGKKGGGRGELSCLSGIEGHSTRLLVFFERASQVGWPAKGGCEFSSEDCSPEARWTHDYISE